MSARRSSRRGTTQPPHQNSAQSQSSSSSTSLSRVDRSTRSNRKVTPPHRSYAHRSNSSEEPDDPTDGMRETRSRKRGHGDDDEDDRGDDLMLDDEEDDGSEETTRCVCGQQDYPGLPLSYREAATRRGLKVTKEDGTRDSELDSELLSDEPEPGSLFIQCDSCNVWQHGGCVGVLDDPMVPEKYFCDECRQDLHKITHGPNGSFSRYLPLFETSSSRSSSTFSNKETGGGRRGKDRSRQSANSLSNKRRSTMNSRDAAYDEEEQLRRAIEQSKEEASVPPEEVGTRRTKRGRSESEENKQATKRPRTGTESPAELKQETLPSPEVSEDESKPSSNGTGRKSKTTSRAVRDRDSGERDVEKERAEAAGRRKGRAERRRADEEEAIEETAPTKPSEPPASLQPTPDVQPPPSEPVTTPRTAGRKTGRPARRGRLGRNQYTRDRDLNGDGHAGSPLRAGSRDGTTDVTPPNGIHHHVNGTADVGRASKPKYMNPNRTSMNDMKKRVSAILEFISHLQVEMATTNASKTNPSDSASTPGGNADASSSNSDNGTTVSALVRGVNAQLDNLVKENGEKIGFDVLTEKDYPSLTSVEMMDVLTRNLVKWQQEYGKYGTR